MIRLPSIPWIIAFVLAFQAVTAAFAAISTVKDSITAHHAQIERVTG